MMISIEAYRASIGRFSQTACSSSSIKSIFNVPRALQTCITLSVISRGGHALSCFGAPLHRNTTEASMTLAIT